MTSPVPETGFSVQTVNPAEDAAWDARLADWPEASFFHGTSWLRVLQDTYGYKPVYFVQRHEGSIRAVLPLMEVDSWLTGRRGVGLPFTDQCGPLTRDASGAGELWSAALAHAGRRGWRYLECRGGGSLWGDAPASTSFFGHRLDLHGGETQLLAGIEASVRRAVRKAGESGLAISVSQAPEAVHAFYALLCKTRQRHGLPAQPFRFFANIHRHVLARNQGHVVLARQGSQTVAGAIFFHFGNTAIYKFGASDAAMQHLRANNLVMWEAIKWHARHGYAHLDFGRTSLVNEGLRKFKLGWGTVERRIDYVRHDMKTRSFVTVRDGASGWYTRLFRTLPISLSRLAGAVLYKHVA